MRIAVDVTPLSHPRTGIGNYLRGMLAGLGAVAADKEIVAFGPVSADGRRSIVQALAGLPIDVRLTSLPFAHAWRTAWSTLGRPATERFIGEFDVLHFSDWMYPPQRSGVRTTTIHDLVPHHFPGWVDARTRRMHLAKYRHAVRTCHLVLVNSRFTATDVSETLGVPPERVRVAHPGIDPRFSPQGEHAELGSPYVLGISAPGPRKNVETLTAAVKLLRERHDGLILALVGEGAAGAQSDWVRALGYVSDKKLRDLYRGARVFAYPSLFEGFGLPIVEAMASGCPVVASAHPSLDEAAGDAALRADPRSTDELADALGRALEEPGDLVVRGLAHASRFTWEACGRAALEAYESARQHYS